MTHGKYTGDLVEALRWAERTVGVLVRRGQRGPDKYIVDKGDGNRPQDGMLSSATFFGHHNDRTAAYKMTDGVTDEQFAQALDRCRVSGSLARSRVIAEITSEQPPHVRDYKRPEALRRTRRVNINQVIESTLQTLEGIFMGLDALEKEDYDSLDPSDAARWSNELNNYVGDLRKLRGRVQNVNRTARN